MARGLNVVALMVMLVAALLHSSVAQTTHVVGGNTLGWQVPPGGPTDYSNWASTQNFSVGDILVFNFASGSHSVALATRSTFDACDTSAATNPITTSPVSITLTTGEHFYICTFSNHCSGGQKLAINVTGNPTTTSPPSSPPGTTAPPPPGTTAPPPPNAAAPSLALAGVPVALLSIAMALFY